jgi:hypothetical protein
MPGPASHDQAATPGGSSRLKRAFDTDPARLGQASKKNRAHLGDALGGALLPGLASSPDPGWDRSGSSLQRLGYEWYGAAGRARLVMHPLHAPPDQPPPPAGTVCSVTRNSAAACILSLLFAQAGSAACSVCARGHHL